MTDPIAEFFDGLYRRGHERRLEKRSGIMRFDLACGEQVEHWVLAIDGGDLSVSREARDADCVLYSDRDFFGRVVAGEAKPLTAMVRNDIRVEGKLSLFIMFERLLPGPPGARDPRDVARERRRQP
ncbi:Putative sterol carrier protein [Micromonospora rhizosphaerae]|uniref:Putative sterol carrier protein n=1 Tax=Micromonospora rhizosphaerae TaxID=568872 RepID=A0A1C6RM47_9ACTN|nr:SCP2 sterol-binding domain-containing protein [Micromonospora rhizosphaerae]SCL18105.1 Putative sterol carrier protein [Micromonospora rhizosphaerae]